MPTASYRLQLTPAFGFDALVARLDTIASLGVSHLYLSPIAQAVPESEHGYDVVDHTTVRREFGGEDALGRLLDAAHDRGLGVLVDHVPNHVSVEHPALNDRWWTMLRDGPASPAARWFDVDWEAGAGRVIVPRLGEPLDDVLSAGGISTGVGALGPEVRYGPLRFPLASGTEGMDLPEALRHQHYTLSWWRDPARNVRRFFTIDDLVAVRVEHDDVAEQIDTIPRLLVEHPAFAGVRVDHVDGLAEPGRYLAGLRRILGERLLFVEKILGDDERLPMGWPVDGTTGYEHITAAEHALVDSAAEQPLVGLWSTRVDPTGFAELERRARREALDDGLAPDLGRVVRTLGDQTSAPDLEPAVIELTLALERYRTYLPDDPASLPVFEAAVDHAIGAGSVEAVADALLSDPESLQRWQQLTGPVMAKGAEDCAFYRYFPLASWCEVGGTPGRFAIPVAQFHHRQLERQLSMPAGMLAGTTHDTKRSSGVRARSLALAAHASDWVRLAERWMRDRADVVGDVDPALVLLGLQTAVTARPLTVDRLNAYLVKAAREADLVTSWADPDPAVERGLGVVAEALIGDIGDDGVLAGFATRVEELGARIDLALLSVQLTCPGFADLYQGSPAGLYSLVDPDNRIPPNWDRLAELVGAAGSTDPATAMANGEVDLARTVVVKRVLARRARQPDAFGRAAEYTPLEVSGTSASDVLGYVRSSSERPALAVVTARASGSHADGLDADVVLPPGSWTDLVRDGAPRIDGGGPLPVVDLVGDLGLALLEHVISDPTTS